MSTRHYNQNTTSTPEQFTPGSPISYRAARSRLATAPTTTSTCTPTVPITQMSRNAPAASGNTPTASSRSPRASPAIGRPSFPPTGCAHRARARPIPRLRRPAWCADRTPLARRPVIQGSWAPWRVLRFVSKEQCGHHRGTTSIAGVCVARQPPTVTRQRQSRSVRLPRTAPPHRHKQGPPSRRERRAVVAGTPSSRKLGLPLIETPHFCSAARRPRFPGMPLWALPDDATEDPTALALRLRARHARALGPLRRRRRRSDKPPPRSPTRHVAAARARRGLGRRVASAGGALSQQGYSRYDRAAHSDRAQARAPDAPRPCGGVGGCSSDRLDSRAKAATRCACATRLIDLAASCLNDAEALSPPPSRPAAA